MNDYRNIIKKQVKEEDEILGNIISQFYDKTLRGQQQKSYSVSQIVGAIRLAYHRGKAVEKKSKPIKEVKT